MRGEKHGVLRLKRDKEERKAEKEKLNGKRKKLKEYIRENKHLVFKGYRGKKEYWLCVRVSRTEKKS